MALLSRTCQRFPLWSGAFVLLTSMGLLDPHVTWCQSNHSNHFDERELHLDAEINVTVRDSSGSLILVSADVRLSLDGLPFDHGGTSKGRVSFVTRRAGQYTITVDALGYRSGQKDVSVVQPTKYEVEVILEPASSPYVTPGTAAGNLILAPKAKQALDEGIQALIDNKLDEAEKALDQALKLAPSHPAVLYVQGVLNLKKSNFPKAQTFLEKAAQIDPKNARALAALGMALCDQKKYAEAIPPLEKALQLDHASDWETHWSLAESYYYSERYDEALKIAQQAQVKSKGQVPQVQLLVAKALAAVGRYEDSAKVLRELLKNHSSDPEAATARRYLERLTAHGKIAR
jgi:Flp pilus assembly protein TadD